MLLLSVDQWTLAGITYPGTAHGFVTEVGPVVTGSYLDESKLVHNQQVICILRKGDKRGVSDW
jgi:hypothetical protein